MNTTLRLTAAAAVFLAWDAVTAQAPQGSWPVGRGDAPLRGVAPASLQIPLKLAWHFKGAGPILATPVSDGESVFIGDGEGRFFALSLADGSKKWEFVLKDSESGKPSGDPIESSAALSGDKVIFGGTDGTVYALDKVSGKQAWTYSSPAEIKAGITSYKLADGTDAVVMAGFAGEVTSLKTEDGSKFWTFDAGGPIAGAASVDDVGLVFGGCNGTLDVLDPLTGHQKHRIDIKIYMPNSVALRDGIGYFAHSGNKIEAWNLREPKEVWTFHERDFPYFTSPAVNEEVVIAGGDGKRLYCLERKSGKEKWSFRTRDKITSSAVIAGPLVVFGSEDGRLYVLDLAKGEEKWSYEVGAPIKSSPAYVKGHVLIGADDGRVYCFAPAAE